MMTTHLLSLDDETLISGILDNSDDWRERLSILLRRHHNSLVTRCYIYLKNRQDAEDAAQETEIKVFQAISRFRQDSGFRTWLFAIGDRQCHDLVRKRSKHVLSDQIRSLIEIYEDSIASGHELVTDEAAVRKVLDEMPMRERDVLMLRFYVDLSLQEMGEYLGLGLSATKMRFYRAVELFGVRLQAEQRVI